MVSALLGLCLFVAADKPKVITAKNIEPGKVGVIKELKVTRVSPNSSLMDGAFDGIEVLIVKYPTKGIGVGKILPETQLWLVSGPVKGDFDDGKRIGWYVIEPYKKKDKK
jgi:hypothetical protein